MSDYVVATVEELDEGERILVHLEGRDIGVFNVDGNYYAYTNWCAHQSGPVCKGPLSGTQESRFDPETLETDLEWCREGEILNCPWHGWEYDVTTGECLSVHRDEVALVSHSVSVEDGDIIVTV